MAIVRRHAVMVGWAVAGLVPGCGLFASGEEDGGPPPVTDVPAPMIAGAAGSGSAPAAGETAQEPGAAGTASGDKGACCAVGTTAGCIDTNVEACVCGADPNCCAGAWDEVCVALVEGAACGSCKASCCESGTATGCADAAIQHCVCEGPKGDPNCCNVAWDAFCVLLVDALGCGACGG